MVDKYPLWDGNNIDLDARISRHPDVGEDGTKKRTLNAAPYFLANELPPWLSYNTDNGPASPTFNADGSITLFTGTTAQQDQTWLETDFALNWDEWTTARVYVVGYRIDDPGDVIGDAPVWGDGQSVDALGEGFGTVWFNEVVSERTIASGSVQHDSRTSTSPPEPTTVGYRVEEHELGSGHTFTPELRGFEYDNYPEEDGFPTATAETMTFGARTVNTAADRSCTMDNIYIELLP